MMKAERIVLSDFLNTDKPIYRTVLERIGAGAVFVYPTETIYGIGGNGLLDSVSQRVLAAKKRLPENPFILVASMQSCFSSLKPSFSAQALYLADAFWPGPLTQIVACDQKSQTIALRVTDYPFIAAVNKVYSFPLISTSANISGEPYNGDPDAIYDLFCDDIDFMIDAGVLPLSPPSTVVKISLDSVVIIREGAIKKEEIFGVIHNH